MGELALEGAEIAPGSHATLQALTNEDRRPAIPREPLPQAVIDFVPAVEFNLEDNLFCKTLRSARRGAACGPSGMTYEHLRPVLSSRSDLVVLHKLGERFAIAQVPQPIVDAVRMGRVSALRKRDGGVRGIVAGDVFRRLVRGTDHRQAALSTRAGCECVAHVLQGICELDPTTTITSIDGISAFDLVSHRAMLSGLHRLEMGNRALPFVRMFYGDPSSYWWEDDGGVSHRIRQGEGGEQGDALMPLLFALASMQHSKQFRGSSALVNGCSRTMTTFTSCPHLTQSEQSAPFCNMSCSHMMFQVCNKGSRHWGHRWATRNLFPPIWSGIAKHAVLLERIPLVPDVQSAWLLLVHCAQARATYLLRSLQPSRSEEFARSHDAGMLGCLCSILQLPVDQCDEGVRHTAALPLVLGGLGLRNA